MEALGGFHTRCSKLTGDEALQIEVPVTGLPASKVRAVALIPGAEPSAKGIINLVALLRNTGADCRPESRTVGAEFLHRGDGRLDNAADSPLPARMRRPDHARLGVGEQHGSAIRCENSEQQARPVGHERVGTRALGVAPGADHDDAIGRVDLIGRDELRVRSHSRPRAPAILRDGSGIVAGAKTHVQAGDFALRHTAAAVEEAVPDALKRLSTDDLDAIHRQVSQGFW